MRIVPALLRFLRGFAFVGIGAVTGCDPGPSEQPRSAEASPPAGRSGPPNVLLLSIDTLRADALGCYGNPRARTPNLDALAARSLRFETVRAPSPWTLPSHATLFTGLSPEHHGVTGERRRLGPALRTLAERFAEAGYRTAAFTDAGYLHEGFGLLRGFEEVDSRGGGFERIAREAQRWLTSLDPRSDRPWFLFLHCYDVHSVMAGELPYASDADLRAQFVAEVPRWLQGDGSVLEERLLRDDLVTSEEAEPARLLYDAAVASLDRRVGRFLADLETTAPASTTILAVVSDHGECFGEHGLLGHSHALYEELLRVPWILRVPDRAAAVDTRPAALADVAPTLAALAGLPAFETADGRSRLGEPTVAETPRRFGASLDGTDVSWIAQLRARGYARPIDSFAVLEGDLKLLEWTGSERRELFDLAADPRERRVLDPGTVPGAAALVESLDALRAETPLDAPQEGESLIELLRRLGYVR